MDILWLPVHKQEISLAKEIEERLEIETLMQCLDSSVYDTKQALLE